MNSFRGPDNDAPLTVGEADSSRGVLRMLTCGAVDSGKSTLIGRLLHETGQILDDEMAALVADSKVHGTLGENVDFALLVDGLEAEREQSIAIDVAARFLRLEACLYRQRCAGARAIHPEHGDWCFAGGTRGSGGRCPRRPPGADRAPR